MALSEELVAPWAEWQESYQDGQRLLEAGTYALTEGAVAAGLGVFAGYPITPATDIAEYMSKRLPQIDGYYLQAEDELAGMHMCAGASLGGQKAMTATSGPGYTLMHDAYGWAIVNEIPVVVVDAMRVGPVSGITGAPGQGEFYVSRYCSHGGNIETIVLSPNSVQETFWLTIDAFNLAERFRTVVTILTDQVVADMFEDLFLPGDYGALSDIVVPRRHNLTMPFFPADSSEIDLPPNVIGEGTGVCVSPYTHTEEGYDIEEMEAQWSQTFRLINKIRHHKDEILRYEAVGLDDAEVIAVAYGATARTVKTAVLEARRQGVKAGFLRLISLWPFPDELFERDQPYLVCELNYDGQLVREVMRAAPDKNRVHFMGKSGEMHTVAEVCEALEGVAKHQKMPQQPYIWTEVR
ncbi:MAG: 2-oxoglutarate ferredoxin oxidoreductase subunit alpha [Alphaproteobacteria bacterium]|jgi:2-oxoglutarate ferredoxin oxidoreductase subunit alpha|nr:2-oxoglutarate ferredoxin oxidoreductase subunit alpha [Alphaproteobacteria bacterium]MDP6563201.1 2-oxoglutarate ferredoxin oxidoreductase subunit alpha [Alphaproteobacteria bacterium]MDP6814772.1 2-oxoglutarate ferredoxin oxidoreductase subunit alpha [Alphaproteobacteria bacterium]